MAAITAKFGEGGKNLTPDGSAAPTLATALRDIADDLTALNVAVAPPAATVGADLGAFTSPPTEGEMAALRTFVNALKADVAAIRTAVTQAAATLKTSKG